MSSLFNLTRDSIKNQLSREIHDDRGGRRRRGQLFSSESRSSSVVSSFDNYRASNSFDTTNSEQNCNFNDSSRSSINSSKGSRPSTRSSTVNSTSQINPVSETNVVAVVSINGTGEILYSNPKAQSIFECPKLTGRSIHDFVPESFRARHIKMISSFFDKTYVGERLDPDTIIRAYLESGRYVPLHLALETKVDVSTRKPSIAVAFITEATTIIEQSKVEKMLSRATLVVVQQFISQTIICGVSGYELLHTTPLNYGDTTDDEAKLAVCQEYSYQELSNGNAGGEDDKMMFFLITSALTILIAVLPLYVNRGQIEANGQQKTSYFRRFANSVNDFQDYLANYETFRAMDLVGITVVVSMINLYLFFELSTLPQEYELKDYHECEEKAKNKIELTLLLSVVGLIPLFYLCMKSAYKYAVNGSHGLFTTMVSPTQHNASNNASDIEAPVVEYSKRKRFQNERRDSMMQFGAQCPIYEASVLSMDFDSQNSQREMTE